MLARHAVDVGLGQSAVMPYIGRIRPNQYAQIPSVYPLPLYRSTLTCPVNLGHQAAHTHHQMYIP